LTSSLCGVQNVTLQGAGHWHSIVRTSRFIDRSSSTGHAHIKDFAVIGEVTERVDANPEKFVNGSLGKGSSVSGRWLQHLKAGLWLMGDNDNGVRVRQDFLRDQGDDALAMWSLYAPDTNSGFENNTIIQPNDNLISDDGDTLVRTGAMNPNWNCPMGALRVDSYDNANTAQVKITNTSVSDSPYSAFEFVSGSGRGFAGAVPGPTARPGPDPARATRTPTSRRCGVLSTTSAPLRRPLCKPCDSRRQLAEVEA
jgi:hypothetical protein